MLTITRTEGIAAVLSHPFVCLLIVAAYAAVALIIWLDRRPSRNPFALSESTQARRLELRRLAADSRAKRGAR